MRRREFLSGVGGLALTSLTAPAQARDGVRRLGVLMNLSRSDSEANARLTAFAAALAGVAKTPGSALVVTPSTSAFGHRDLIVGFAARHRLPAIYPFRLFAAAGGLMSYGPNPTEPFERAADYVHRILKGEKPGELPVQGSSKYDLALNVKTAKALGLEIPSKLLFTADEVIE
jgi:putative tryptophan/tyrosine transport system substrate-binding protein